MARSMTHEVTYPHPPERVWRALTEREALSKWLMQNDLQETRVGQKFTFSAEPMPGWDGKSRCEVLEVVPLRKLVWSWWGGEGKPATQVTWSLESVEGGRKTKLRLEHTGLTGFNGFLMYVFMNNGWGKKMLRGSLPALLDTWAAPAAPPAR